jgi:hypothetical protein
MSEKVFQEELLKKLNFLSLQSIQDSVEQSTNINRKGAAK